MKRALYFFLSALCLGYYLWIGWNNDFGLSLLPFWLVLAVIFLLLGCVQPLRLRMPERFRRIVRLCLLPVLALVLIVEGCIFWGMTKKGADGLDCIIVLGAALNGEGPSTALEARLETAADYLVANPGTEVIASGGQGVSEVISEAQAMKNWLVARGVDPARIRMEDRSTDTAENIRYSLAMLDSGELRVGIVTSNFHVFRALGIARSMAGERYEVYGLAAPFSPRLLPHYLVREFCSVCVDTLRGNLRWF